MTDIEIIKEIEFYFGLRLNKVEYENLKIQNKFSVNRIEGTHNFSINNRGEVDGICLDFCQKPLPKDLLESLQNLKFLSLRNNFSRKDISFKAFPKLESLDLCKNNLCDISFLSDITELISIDLSHNKLTSISIPKGLYKLTTLNLKYNRGFNDLAPLIPLKELTTLDISHNKLTDISSLNKLEKLTSLNLRKTIINQEAIIGGLKGLNANLLNRNEYLVLKDLKNLITLDLSEVSLNSFSFIENLTSLESINLINNHLSDVGFLKNLPKITSLNLSKNNIRDFAFLKGLSNLTSINLSDNSISDIAFLKGLKELRSVNLNNNLICDINFLNELDKLKDIQLKGNRIKEIPYSLLKFNLHINIDDRFAKKCINLFGNPIEKPDLVTIRQGYNAIKNWLESTKVVNNEIKLVIIGNSTVGKTSLLEYLIENKNPENKPTTHGITISKWNLDEKNLHINLWDFGGQEYYHATHRLFLSNGAIYILLWDFKTDHYTEQDATIYNEKGEEYLLRQRCYKIQYWLETIRENFSSDGEILLVQNKIDENGEKKVADYLLKQYKVYKETQFHISVFDAYKYQETKENNFEINFDNFKKFKKYLLESIKEKGENQEIIKHTAILREKLRLHKDNNYWTWKHYSDFCYKEAEESISEDQLDILTEYLHNTGVIIYYGCDPNFRTNELLKDVVFLNPNFITKSIYTILSSDVRKANGIFTRGYAMEKIGDDFIVNRIIELMKSPNFELIFYYDKNPDTFYATSYLPDNYPDTEEAFACDSADLMTNLVIHFYQYFTPSFFSRFLSSFGNRTNKGKIWKTGVFLAKNGERAFVECLFNERKIVIKTSKRYLGKEILDEFIRIVGKTDFEISLNGIDHFVSYMELKRNKHNAFFWYKNNEFASSEYLNLLDDYYGKLPRVLILTAIDNEYIAVRKNLQILDNSNNIYGNYENGIFVLEEKHIANVIIQKCGQGNVGVGIKTIQAITQHKPDLILFVGIAGSRKPNDFSVGDVVIAEKVYYYERGKAEKSYNRTRPELYNINSTILQIAKSEIVDGNWKKLIKNNCETRNVKANIGVIATGEKIIEHQNSPTGRLILNHYNDASAVETEGFGFLKAVFEHEVVIPAGVIRGISDIIKNDENDNSEILEKRTEIAKEFASDTAAAFAYWLIYKFYDNQNIL